MVLCCVAGCPSRHVGHKSGGKHFFHFPKENLKNKKIVENWILFTKIKNFKPNNSSTICEDHFSSDRIVIKNKGKCHLLTDSVPTIYLKKINDKIQKIAIPYDPETQEYLETDHFIIPNNSQGNDQETLTCRDKLISDTKSRCRYCLDSVNNVECITIEKLNSHIEDSIDFLKYIEVESPYSELLSEIVCEKCFTTLIELDAYLKKCRKAQTDFVQQIQEIDDKIQESQGSKIDFQESQSDFNNQQIDEIEMEVIVEDQPNYVIEEHLEEGVFDENEYVIVNDVIENVNENQSVEHEIIEDEIVSEYVESSSLKAEPDDFFDSKDKYENVDQDSIILNPVRNSFAYRTYECFFCKLKFAGRKTFKAHDCEIKELKCEVEGCEKIFTSQSGYRRHVIRTHGGQMPISKHFCAICKEVINSTDDQFKQHRRLCNKKLSDKEQTIECEICKKQCKNLQSYTVHKLFHSNRDISKSAIKKSSVICELCGNKFTTSQGLRTHRRNVHLIGSTGEVYECDICSKKRPSKRSLFNHMRNVHRVQKTPCTICGKIFKTKALLQKHAMYHDESKRVHFCHMCPDKPGYFTAVALRRHQKSHLLGVKQLQCDYCEATFTTSQTLKKHQQQNHVLQI